MKFTTIPTSETLTDKHIENVTKWITSLRAGEYKQCNERLIAYTRDSYCCLGVACDLVGMEKTEEGRAGFKIGSIFYDNMPPFIEFKKDYGFEPDFQIAFNGGCTYSLARLNDFLKLTFIEISDVIEASIINKEAKEFNLQDR